MSIFKQAVAVLLSCVLASPSTSLLSQSAPSAPADRAPLPSPHTPKALSSTLQRDARILHALNRFTFGPRPGDLDAVRTIGLEKWFNQQLHPELRDESDLDARLAEFPAMRETTQALLYRLPSNAMIRQAANGKAPIPGNFFLHAIYVNQMARVEERKQNRERKVAEPANPAGMDKTQAADDAAQPADPAPSPEEIARILALPPRRRLASLASMDQGQIDSFRKALKPPQRAALNAGLSPLEREQLAALQNPQQVVAEELAFQRLAHDIYSSAQLQEVMTDFWLNHFNVFLHKNDETPYYLVSYERDVIRPRALGKFEDLLEAVAHSPAMLLYLDNASSIGPGSKAADRAKQGAEKLGAEGGGGFNPREKPAEAARALAPEAPFRPGATQPPRQGLNENYARELMELHTLGVNGGYTQKDVTEVARILTGWTVDRPQRGGDFQFNPNRHEPGTKKVLGKKFKEDGEQEGRELLHMLATRPATARFLSRKLAIRFVSDDPPASLVDRMAKSYLGSHGDISAVLRTLFSSPEFWQPGAYRAKVKTPLEYVVSAARASNANIDNFQPLVNALRDMGMPLYGAVPPTGYKWDAADWVSTGALVNRMNFALALAANRLPGISITWQSTAASPPGEAASASPAASREEQRLESILVPGGLSNATRTALLEQLETQSSQVTAPGRVISAQASVPAKRAPALEMQDQLLAGLLLGSPEFQRR